ncbi:glycosyltransferase family 4 protein [Microlunatus speluncae]|uniref:glycosyltransferase family 4 protein n=1 Tax=Microlunatus speluncae TaxID=2594267 RepID=UPI0012663E52|nr:glycosyltransferase family 4 protein [Microlunatus speluncae]
MSSSGLGHGPRIGLVCPYSFDQPGGVQNHVVGLAGFLARNGFRPRILGPGRPDGLIASSLAEAELPPSVFSSAGPAVPVPYNGSVARVNFGPVSAARVRQWLRDGGFDLLHLHEPITPSVSMLALWASTAPVVATFHTATPRSRSMRLAGGVLRGSIGKIDTGIAVSESARQVVVRYLGRDAIVVPNGFSHGEFTESAEARRPLGSATAWRGGDRPRLAFLGRLDEPRKGLDVLLAALPMIRAGARDLGIDELEVVIAGQSGRGATGRGRRALPPGCRGVGMISNVERAGLLGTTDVFVAPHRARESFGIVLLEAMASGAPIVASDLPAFVDLLRDGDDDRLGELFPAGDPDRLAAAVIATLADRPAVRQRAGRARSASRGYDWAMVGPRVVEAYDGTLGRPTPSLAATRG